MPVNKVKVWVLKDGVHYDGVPLNKGACIQIDESLVQDWVRLGLASLQEPPAPAPAKPAPKAREEAKK